MGKFFRIILLVSMALAVSACKKDTDTNNDPKTGRVIFLIDHKVDGNLLEENQLIYTNAAGNQYMVGGLKYFISEITFYKQDGTTLLIHQWKDLFYVDEEIPSTKKILFYDPLPAGKYDSISFIFGITVEKNKSFMFINPPEVNMFWPEVLGGGYHYMMLDGKWKDTTGTLQPFNFHLGIGQLYHGTGFNTDSIYAFVQNYFRVSLPGSSFFLNDNDTLPINLRMNLESWFETPIAFDFNQWGGAIMQNQPAMEIARENGKDVFSILPLNQ